MEELICPISLGFDVVRSLFTDRIDEMIRHVQSLPTTVFQEEVRYRRYDRGTVLSYSPGDHITCPRSVLWMAI